MTFNQAGMIRWMVNNRMEFFVLTKDKHRSKRYKISHDYNIKKDAQESDLYQKDILAVIEKLLTSNL